MLPDVRDGARALALAAHEFFRACAAPEPEGAYRFWPLAVRARPGPDLDDTALVRLALHASGAGGMQSAVDCMRLFGPYRLAGGSRPHPTSAWASAFHGAFGTWMDESSVIVDACANANVVRLLQVCDARQVPGYGAAIALLAFVLGEGVRPDRAAPYYRSGWMLAWLCATLEPPDERSCAQECALRSALERRLTQPMDPGASFADVLLAQCAKVRCGLAPSAAALAWLFALQSADGGWPEVPVCWNFAGTLGWTSRSFPTALVLQLLMYGLRGKATC